MKQKCILSKKKNTLVVKEVAQTEPGSFSLVYEMELENTVVEEAVAKGTSAIIDLFRSVHFYPVSFFADKIADGVAGMFGTDPVDSLHIEFNDVESLQTTIDRKEDQSVLDKEKELAEIDKLLEDDDDAEIGVDIMPTVEKAGTETKTDDTPKA